MASISRAELKQLIFDLFEEDEEFAHTLFVMSHNRKKLIELIWSLQPHINEHLMKLLMYPSHESRAHWIKEIRTWLNDIGTTLLKPKNNKLKEDKYYDNLYLGPFEGGEQQKLMFYYFNGRKSFESNSNYDGITLPVFERKTIPFEEVNQKFADFYREISQLFAQKYYDYEQVEVLIHKYFLEDV